MQIKWTNRGGIKREGGGTAYHLLTLILTEARNDGYSD